MGFLPNIEVTIVNATDDQLARHGYAMNTIFREHLGEEVVVNYFSAKKIGLICHLGSRNHSFRSPLYVVILGVIDEERDWENNKALRQLIRRDIEETLKLPVIFA